MNFQMAVGNSGGRGVCQCRRTRHRKPIHIYTYMYVVAFLASGFALLDLAPVVHPCLSPLFPVFKMAANTVLQVLPEKMPDTANHNLYVLRSKAVAASITKYQVNVFDKLKTT